MSKRRDTPDTTQLGLEVGAELLARWKAYVKARGETYREAAERAFARDMANPPGPVTYPPLPPLPVPGSGPVAEQPVPAPVAEQAVPALKKTARGAKKRKGN